MPDRAKLGLPGRILLIVLTLYALAMIGPDLLRIVRPIASFGLASNANGLVYDVQSPFTQETDSPAWQAGIRVGDRLDLARMRCLPVTTELCASMLAQWGGLNYVVPGRTGTFMLAATPANTAREIHLAAQPRPPSLVRNFVLLLDEIAGIAVILGAAWLVWTHPGGMTWGFFAYAIQFNPGQSFQFYAWLQLYPPAQLAQSVASCLLQAAGYTGFLLFALRVPANRTQGAWRRLERALPPLAIAFFLIALTSLGNIFGYRAEFAMRAGVLIGFGVGVAALAILIGRRNGLAPQEYQRIRWVIWGCLIGLPAYLLAELAQETSLFSFIFGAAVPDDLLGLFYLVNGILCLFVVEAVRRPTVVSVSIPLRRATLLSLMLSLPAFLLHTQIEMIDHYVHMPNWAWLLVASVLAFLITRLHELATHLADHLFDLDFHRAEAHLETVRHALIRTTDTETIDRLLADEPVRALRLASAAVFREHNGSFRRQSSAGWESAHLETITPSETLQAALRHNKPFDPATIALPETETPTGVARPILAVPVGNPRRCFALVLYGDHVTGTDIDRNESALLEGLARDAAIAYAQAETETLRARVATLEAQLSRVAAAT